MNITKPCVCLAVLAGLALTAQPALAQSKDATKTLSGKNGSGKPLTFKELEACLKEQDTLTVRGTDIKQRQDKQHAERAAIEQEGQLLKGGTPEMQALSAKVKDFNGRQQAFVDKVNDWKKRQDASAETDRTGQAAERERRDLKAEMEELKKTEAALKDEATALGAEREKVGADALARGKAQAAAADDWNTRNHQLVEQAQAFEDDRAAWSGRCANRPYNEAFEKMIRAGK